MAPNIFYRVEDKGSRAQYVYKRGILAEDRTTVVDFHKRGSQLRRQVENHLDWGSRTSSPFISMYNNEEAALNEAERRVEAGKKEVVVHQIDTWKKDRLVEYRNMRLLAKKIGAEIPKRAWHNSKYEYIALHHIPNSAILGSLEMG
jgi:hypothetical protein